MLVGYFRYRRFADNDGREMGDRNRDRLRDPRALVRLARHLRRPPTPSLYGGRVIDANRTQRGARRHTARHRYGLLNLYTITGALAPFIYDFALIMSDSRLNVFTRCLNR